MGSRDQSQHHDPEGSVTLEQLRARRNSLAERIQSLLSELETAEREFDTITKELESRLGERR